MKVEITEERGLHNENSNHSIGDSDMPFVHAEN
jgi:hypothetical protein